MKIEKLRHDHLNPQVFDVTLYKKINQLIDAWNSQQEENCKACEWKYVSGYEPETVKHTCEEKKEEWVERDPIMRNRDIICPVEKDQPSKPSIRGKTAEIIYESLRALGITFNTIDSKHIVDQILDLVKKTAIEEIDKQKVYDNCNCIYHHPAINQPSKPSIKEELQNILHQHDTRALWIEEIDKQVEDKGGNVTFGNIKEIIKNL